MLVSPNPNCRCYIPTCRTWRVLCILTSILHLEFKEIRKEWKARKKEEDNQRKAEDERNRSMATGQPGVDANGTDPSAQTPTTQAYPGSRPHLPPIGYSPAGGQGAGQYPQGGEQMYQQQAAANGQMYSTYPHSPYSQATYQQRKSPTIQPFVVLFLLTLTRGQTLRPQPATGRHNPACGNVISFSTVSHSESTYRDNCIKDGRGGMVMSVL